MDTGITVYILSLLIKNRILSITLFSNTIHFLPNQTKLSEQLTSTNEAIQTNSDTRYLINKTNCHFP